MGSPEDLIHEIYGSLSGREGHQRFVASMARAFNARLMATQLDGPGHRHFPLVHYDHTGQHRPELDELACSIEIRNPWFVAGVAPRLIQHGVASEEGLVEPARLRRTDFYDQVLRPIDVFHSLAFMIDWTAGNMTLLSVNRPAHMGYFDTTDEALGRHLLPHLRNLFAIQKALVVDPSRAGHTSMAWALDAGGAVVGAKHTRGGAEFCIVERGRRLFPMYPPDRTKMAEAIAKVAAEASLREQVMLHNAHGLPVACARVHRAESPLFMSWLLAGLPSILVVVRPIRAGRADVEPVLRLAHGLTKAECRVAMALYETESVHAVARILERSEETIRSQLKSIYAKTGVSSQLRLLRMMDAMAVD